MYSKRITDFINEFFRHMAITMKELKSAINLGNSFKKKSLEMGMQEAAAPIQKDVDELQVLVDHAQGYSDHIEKLIKDCVPERIIMMKLTEYTMGIHGFLLTSVQEIEVKLKESGIPFQPIRRF